MLDVHAPHEPMHGLRDFFLHLFTISVGLLIAVGIEAAVTRHEHHKLANEAAEVMTEEIRRNAAKTDDALLDIERQQKRMSANLDTLQKIQFHPASQDADNATLDASYGLSGLEKTAWRTAQATNALAYMPYEQAQRFSGIYDQVQTFEKAQDAIVEDEAQFLGVLKRTQMPNGHISKEAADALAERFGVWQGHLLNLHIATRLLQEQQRAFLEHREPARHMKEAIGG